MLYGRDGERARMGALLEAARESRSGALVVRGEPGIGKTALLEDTRERADDMHVLTARGVESESELPFAALHQLLRTTHAYVERLPEPQADALRGALGLVEAEATERFLVSAACLSLLSELSERRPVLCLIDDAHWLDTASAETLLFVARRLEAEGIVMVFAAREGDVRSFDAEGVPSLFVQPLDAAASAALLERDAPVGLATRVVDRLVEQTNGNALALLEAPTALSPEQLAGDEPFPDKLPITEGVERIFLERVRRLPEETQRLLLVAAADDSEELGLVLAAAAALGVHESALDTAERSRLVSVHGTRIDFRHPLVRSAVYGAATSSQQRAAHRALADALSDRAEQVDRRAWHLASSVLEPDEEIARGVERVAERAQASGGYASAARALERAAELSPDPSARTRRLVAAATSARVAGANEYAAALAKQAAPVTKSPEQRADVALALGLGELQSGRPLDVVPMLMEAAREVERVDPERAVQLLVLVVSAASQSSDEVTQVEAARLAARLGPTSDDASRIIATFLRGLAATIDGDMAAAASIFDEGLDLAASAEHSYAVFIGSVGALMIGNDERYEALLNRAIALARARGELGTLVEAISLRSAQLLMLQRFDDAAHAAEEALRFGREVRAENHLLMPRGVVAAVAAFRGNDEDAIRLANEVLEVAAAHNLGVRAALAHYALGMLDLERGRWQEALGRFDAVARVNSVHEMRVAADRVEAALRAGRLEHARATAEAFAAWQEGTGSAWAAPRVASCRALLAEGGEASAEFEEALRLASDARPFDRARIRLLYGEHLRRERRRAEARTHLRAALEEFERFRTTPWVDRTAGELRATGETARKRDPSTFDQLTPQEIHISRLVAQGMSNKEVAAQLFLSPRTIDYHLRNVFAKLGLTSRTQLVRLRLGEEEDVPADRVPSA